jgi:myo-inositol 2-dehydrogenase / D-chiro-inositol 1-dehydrogenase
VRYQLLWEVLAMSRRFTVAVIGAGDMGSEHVRGWMLAGHAVLAVADIDSARARALADRHGVPHVYVDYREAIAHPAVEIVSICTPLA